MHDNITVIFYYFISLLNFITILYYYIALLCIIAVHYCSALLQCIIAVHYFSALHDCIALLYGIIIYYYYIRLLNYIILWIYCNIMIPALIIKLVIYESISYRNYKFRLHDIPRIMIPRQYRQGRHLRNTMAPKLLVLTSRHPAKTE